jgi:DNA-binding NarL/FixJ family response regulator
MRQQGTEAVLAKAPGRPGSPPIVELRTSDAALRRVLATSFATQGIRVLGPGDDGRSRSVLVWALDPETGREALERLHPGVRVLALVDHPSPDVLGQLLAAGAQAVLDRAADPGTIANAAVAVARGYLVLPSERRSTLLPSFLAEDLTVDELGWMRALAKGLDVSALSLLVGTSEREMYRKLRVVYRKLRAPTRADALRRLARADLLVDES